MVTVHEDVSEVLLDAEQIRTRVQEMGKEITEYYNGESLIGICILKGAVMFFADLMRALRLECEMDFMGISSYGSGVKTSGIVRIAKDMDISITGRNVLLIEDIMDSGLTLNHLTELLGSRSPKSMRIACLLDKPDRRECAIASDFCGFIIPDKFVVGYGLDYNGHYRQLPYVGVLKPEVYGQ